MVIPRNILGISRKIALNGLVEGNILVGNHRFSHGNQSIEYEQKKYAGNTGIYSAFLSAEQLDVKQNDLILRN